MSLAAQADGTQVGLFNPVEEEDVSDESVVLVFGVVCERLLPDRVRTPVAGSEKTGRDVFEHVSEELDGGCVALLGVGVLDDLTEVSLLSRRTASLRRERVLPRGV